MSFINNAPVGVAAPLLAPLGMLLKPGNTHEPLIVILTALQYVLSPGFARGKT